MTDAASTESPDIGQPAGQHMAAEIAEQPAMLGRIGVEAGPEIAAIAADDRGRAAPRFVLLAARGTSDHAALYAKYLIEVQLGLPAGLVSPSSMTVYESRPDLRDVLFLAVSQSGGSPDLIDSMTVARSCGALTVAVTNNPHSALAEAAEFAVDIRAGVERAVAATKTYTAELLALYLLLSPAAADVEATRRRIDTLVEAAAQTLNHPDAVTAAATRYRFADRLITTARGYRLSDRPRGCVEADGDLLPRCPGVLRGGSAARPDGHGRRRSAGAGGGHAGAGGRAMLAVLDKLAQRRADLLVVGGFAGRGADRGAAAAGTHRRPARGAVPGGGDPAAATAGLAVGDAAGR